MKEGLPQVIPALLSRYRQHPYAPDEYPFSVGEHEISFSDQAAFQLLVAAIQAHHKKYRHQLKEQFKDLYTQLTDILSLEEGDDSAGPAALQQSFDFADHFINFDQLSSVIPEVSREKGDQSRLSRLQQVKQLLEDAEAIFPEFPAVILVEETLFESGNVDWGNAFCRL